MATLPPQYSQKVGFPQISDRLVDESGVLTRPWYQFLRGLWLKTGGAAQYLLTGQFLTNGILQVEAGGTISQTLTGTLDGENNLLITSPVAGSAQEVLTPTGVVGAGWIYTATKQGLLVVAGGRVDFSRDDGVTWWAVSVTGGAIPMLVNDQAKITWYESPPVTIFFPGGA